MHADAKAFCSLLHNTLGDSHKFVRNEEWLSSAAKYRNEWKATLEEWTKDKTNAVEGRIMPREALRSITMNMPKGIMVSTDIGNICSVSNSYLEFQQPRSFFAALTFGNCGFSVPAIMGAKVACPERHAVALVGDGAFGMSFNELLTCHRENIPITVVVFKNDQWGAEKKNQVIWFDDRYIGTNLVSPSFADVAEAMGLHGIRVNHADQVSDAFKGCLAANEKGKAAVLEVIVTRHLGEPFRRDAMKLPKRHLAK